MISRLVPAAFAASAMLLAGCSTASEPATRSADTTEESPTASHSEHGHAGHAGKAARTVPLRDGERRLTVSMPEPYTPSAPNDVASDDYRCFLIDPELAEDVLVTGTDVVPGNPDVVHHVILFQLPPEQADEAQQLDDSTEGQGWTCFGGTGLEYRPQLEDAPWLGGWAPGSGESVLRDGYGVPLAAGSKIVMQVHYNLLAGTEPDVSATRLRVTDGSEELQPVSTMLLPAPVELPCRPKRDRGPLCERDAALEDVKERFGDGAGSAADMLHLLCPFSGEPGPEQSCTRPVTEAGTVIGVAGHMHLLGQSIRIEVNPGTPGARTLLDISEWNFDDQGAQPIEPVRLEPDDQVRVTCRHSQEARDLLPAFEGQPDRWVLWGDGTTDEMCLGILQVAR